MSMEPSTIMLMARLMLTEHIDKGVGHQVAVVIRDVTLVDGTGSRLHIGEDDGVVLHVSAVVVWRICSWIHCL